MNRRKFFGFLPMATVSAAASIAGAMSGPARAEDVDGITITTSGHVTVSNCFFTRTDQNQSLVIKQV